MRDIRGRAARLVWGGRIWSPAALLASSPRCHRTSVAEARALGKMERRRRGRLRHQEEALVAHVAELKTDLSAYKDSRAAAKLAR